MLNLLRNKTVASFFGLMVLGALLGTAHKSAIKTGSPFVVSNVVRSMLLPIDKGFDRLFGAGAWLLSVIRPRGAILRENSALRARVRQLTQENARLREAAEENVRLREALQLRKSSTLRMISAEVISRGASGWFDTATIDRGRRSGVSKGAAVASYMGLVGQVTESDTFTAQVVALSDPSSAVGATVQRSRLSGIVRGQGADFLVLAYLPKDADVRENDVVVSSGMGRVVPKGLPIGRVVKVVRDSVGGTTSALLRPSARLEQVEQVFVVPLGQVPSQ